MKSINSQSPAEPVQNKSGNHSKERLDELRNLLVGPEQQKLAFLQRRLDDPLLRAEEISRSLPDAIIMRSSLDNRIALALQPTIEESIKTSVRKDSSALANAIFPALGPGIRKAIVSTIMGMLQSLNQMLDYSLSFKGLKWRWEAMHTRRPFAEVVLYHTLVYRVEQVFLIHRETSLVLQHVESSEIKGQDPDLVSGMLTAIQDFVQDSFQSDTVATLDTLRYGGDQSIWIEQGPHLILAVVMRGTPPLEFRNQYRDLLDDIHIKFSDVLGRFQGDITPFSILKDQLEACLKFQLKETRTKISPFLWILLIAAVITSGIWVYQTYRTQLRWHRFLESIHAERGLVLTRAGKKDGKYFVSGLRDPSAPDPLVLMKKSRIDSSRVLSNWQTYYALDPASVLARSITHLKPPTNVTLKFRNNTLTAQGRASHDWISRFRDYALTIPGVEAYDDTPLIDTDLLKLEAARKRLEGLSLFFSLGKPQVLETNEKELERVLATIVEIQTLQRIVSVKVNIVIVGHTDASGSRKFNLLLSRERAEYVFRFLLNKGVNPSHIKAIGMGVKEMGPQNNPEEYALSHRTVTFKTFVDIN